MPDLKWSNWAAGSWSCARAPGCGYRAEKTAAAAAIGRRRSPPPAALPPATVAPAPTQKYHTSFGGDVAARKKQYADMVNKYYDLATTFYEYGQLPAIARVPPRRLDKQRATDAPLAPPGKT
jgi:hypothetical protein